MIQCPMVQSGGIVIEGARSADVGRLAEIILETLPGNRLSLLGLPVCRDFLLHTLGDDSFLTLAAREAGEPVGLLVLDVDMDRKSPRAFYYRHWHRVVAAILRRPPLLTQWAFTVLRNNWRRRFPSRHGHSGLKALRRKSVWIEFLAVSGRHRRRGVATALLRPAFDHVASLGKERALLGVESDNVDAIRAYRKMGFQPRGSGGKPAKFIIMEIAFDPGGRSRSHLDQLSPGEIEKASNGGC